MWDRLIAGENYPYRGKYSHTRHKKEFCWNNKFRLILNKDIASPTGVKGVACFLSIDSKLSLLKERELDLNLHFLLCETQASHTSSVIIRSFIYGTVKFIHTTMTDHKKEKLIYKKCSVLYTAKITCSMYFNLHHIIISQTSYFLEGIQTDGKTKMESKKAKVMYFTCIIQRQRVL